MSNQSILSVTSVLADKSMSNQKILSATRILDEFCTFIKVAISSIMSAHLFTRSNKSGFPTTIHSIYPYPLKNYV